MAPLTRDNPILDRLNEMIRNHELMPANGNRLLWKWLSNPWVLWVTMGLIVSTAVAWGLMQYRVDQVEARTANHELRVQALEKQSAARDEQYKSIDRTLGEIKADLKDALKEIRRASP